MLLAARDKESKKELKYNLKLLLGRMKIEIVGIFQDLLWKAWIMMKHFSM